MDTASPIPLLSSGRSWCAGGRGAGAGLFSWFWRGDKPRTRAGNQTAQHGTPNGGKTPSGSPCPGHWCFPGHRCRLPESDAPGAAAPLTAPSAPFGSVHRILDPETGKQHGSSCPAWHRALPPALGVERSTSALLCGEASAPAPAAGTGISLATHRAPRPSARRAGSTPHHADRPGLLTGG